MADHVEYPSFEGTRPIRVGVVDDHALVRSGICDALALSKEITVVGEGGDGLAAIELLEREPLDVLLLDLHMPCMDGFSCLDVIGERWPNLAVIVLTVDEDPDVAVDVMRRGASAYVPKFIRPADLASIVRQVADGTVLIGGHRLVAGAEHGDGHPAIAGARGLTERELEVLTLVATGKTNGDIARELFVTTKTVKFHLTSIFSKLNVTNRTEAAAFAITHGLAGPMGPER
jgi:DNA-binding NarL/FixJ family response regulator